MASVRRIIVGLCAAWLALIAPPAMPQTGRAAPAVRRSASTASTSRRSRELTAGTQLSFSLFGTPGAVASLQIEGARARLAAARSGTRRLRRHLHHRHPGSHRGRRTGGRDLAPRRGGRPVGARRAARARCCRARSSRGADAPGRRRPDRCRPTPRRRRVLGPRRRCRRRAAACSDCAVVESVRAGRDGAARWRHRCDRRRDRRRRSSATSSATAHKRGLPRLLGAIGGALTGREIERRQQPRSTTSSCACRTAAR